MPNEVTKIPAVSRLGEGQPHALHVMSFLIDTLARANRSLTRAGKGVCISYTSWSELGSSVQCAGRDGSRAAAFGANSRQTVAMDGVRRVAQQGNASRPVPVLC